jgi:hypothetical protein
MKHKRAFVKIVAFDFQGPYSFRHRGSLEGHEVFNEAAPMYYEAAIKASFLQKFA